MSPVRNTTSALFLFTIRFVWSSLCFIFINLSMWGDNWWWWRLTIVYFISLNWQFSKRSLHHFPDEKTVSSLNYLSFIASTRTESLCRWTELKWCRSYFFITIWRFQHANSCLPFSQIKWERIKWRHEDMQQIWVLLNIPLDVWFLLCLYIEQMLTAGFIDLFRIW